MRLALETGTSIYPCYVFGGTDFFNNLATGDNFFSRMSRKLRMGIALFYGQFGLPIPYAPRVTLCIGDTIDVQKWEGEGPVPNELIEELQKKVYLSFLKYLQDDLIINIIIFFSMSRHFNNFLKSIKKLQDILILFLKFIIRKLFERLKIMVQRRSGRRMEYKLIFHVFNN